MGSHRSPHLSKLWAHADFTQGKLFIQFPNRWIVSLPLYPILLFFLHGIVFSITFPYLDLPVADDANYFGSGKLFVLSGTGLNADWTPVITYFSILLYKILPLGWYGRFAVYSFICRLLLLWGIYGFTSRFTSDRRWAFLSTVLAAACFSYWIHMNGRAFASGLFLLLLAWMNPQKPSDLLSAIAITAISFLLRPEFILVCGGFGLYAAWAKYRQSSWQGLFRPTLNTIISVGLCLLLWFPIILWGKISTQRLSFAFAQFFQSFIIEKDLLDQAGLKWNSGWNEITDAYFPSERHDRDSLLCRIIPLYEFISANPSIFRQFVGYNTEPFLNAEIILSRSPILSKLLNFYIIGVFIIFLALLRSRRHREQFMPFLYFSLLFLLSVIPCLVTRPFRDYMYAPLIWYFCVIPYFVWPSPRSRSWFATALFLASLLLQYPGWKEIIHENQSLTNWNRAQFVEEASQIAPLQNSILAECYPIFCASFNDAIKRSVHYDLRWDDAGYLRAYGEKGIRVDYVLLEAVPPKHLLAVKKKIQEWMRNWGEKAAEKNGYWLWKVNRRILAPAGEILMADEEESESGFRSGKDEDRPTKREIVIHWNFGEGSFRDFHVYVSVDEGEYVYLGRAGNREALRLIWKPGGRLLAPAFQQGPEFGHQYRFQIYGMPSDDSSGNPPNGGLLNNKPKVLNSQGYVQYSQAPQF